MDKFMTRLQAVLGILLSLGIQRVSDTPEPIQEDLKSVLAEATHAGVIQASGEEVDADLIREIDESITKLEVDVNQFQKDHSSVPAGSTDDADLD